MNITMPPTPPERELTPAELDELENIAIDDAMYRDQLANGPAQRAEHRAMQLQHKYGVF